METLKDILALLGLGPNALQALLCISLASVFVPQLVKRRCPRGWPELIAVVAGAGAGVVFLPPTKGVVAGIIAGAFWTIMYKPIMRRVYKKWPELEDKMSAQKKVVQKADGTLEERDATQPSGANEKTVLIEKPKDE